MARSRLLAVLVGIVALVAFIPQAGAGTGDVTITKKFHEGSSPPPVSDVPLFTDVHWRIEVVVRNRTADTITDAVVTDRFSADIELGQHGPNEGYPLYEGAVAAITCGDVNIEPVSQAQPEGATLVTWTIGTMAPKSSCRLSVRVSTDINPAGQQEYTSPGEHCLNSGATLKYNDALGAQQSRNSGPLCVTTVNP